MKYSVIVPVYNCAQYLESCLESVFSQKTDSEYEILLVDDGSVDGSSQLCDRLAQEHNCIRVIHQANQGVSAARNTGICAAAGEYLLFLDGDDLWREDLLRYMDDATANKPDVVQFGYRTFFENGYVEDCLVPAAVDGESGRDYVSRILNQGIMLIGSACINAHRREFVMQHELRFPVGVANGEDLLFRVREMGKAQRICGVNEALYMYRRNTQSATRNMTLKKMQNIIGVVEEFYQQFPQPVISDFYSMHLIDLADLSREEVGSLRPTLERNRVILDGARGGKARVARLCFKVFGYRLGARIIRTLIQIKNR